MKNAFLPIYFALATFLSPLSAQTVSVNGSYDTYRGLPDGGLNGNSGALLAVQSTGAYSDCVALQLGGSYGLYNWDGREIFQFEDSKQLQWIAFVTGGASSSYEQFNGGIVYDRIFTEHYGIYDLNPTFDQLRIQVGYQLDPADEVGVWGAVALTTAHKEVFGVPINFRSIPQVNLFCTHFFSEYAKITLWGGVPYGNSLHYGSKPAGLFTVGFYLKAPLMQGLSVEGGGSYMGAREVDGFEKSRCYAASIMIGITYSFTSGYSYFRLPYMPIANHSQFLVDTN